jgi:hypothetical protein
MYIKQNYNSLSLSISSPSYHFTYIAPATATETYHSLKSAFTLIILSFSSFCNSLSAL